MLPELDNKQENQSESPWSNSPSDDLDGGRNLFLIIVSWLVGGEYGLIFLLQIIWPFITHWREQSPAPLHDGYTLLMWCFVLVMVAVGMALMNRTLRETTDRKSVRAWMILAAGLAPISSFATLHLMSRGVIQYAADPSDKNPALGAVLLWLLTLPLHFYLPFIVSTIWVRLKYHRSEF